MDLWSAFHIWYQHTGQNIVHNMIIRFIQKWRKKLDNNFLVGFVLIELSKPFDYVPHDPLIAKFAAYDLSEEALIYLSHPSNREQCFRINYIYSEFKNIIMNIPQGSILGSLLFNLLINELFFFILMAYIILHMTTSCLLLLKMSKN